MWLKREIDTKILPLILFPRSGCALIKNVKTNLVMQPLGLFMNPANILRNDFHVRLILFYRID